MVWRFLDRLFEFESLTPPWSDHAYLHRWRLLALPGKRRIYLHRFLGPDWGRDPHDHPKWFLSIGLWGSYTEEYAYPYVGYTGKACGAQRTYRAPWVRLFPATHIHRIKEIGKRGCWTLVVTGRKTREWGFWRRNRRGKFVWVPWEQYVRGMAPF